MPLRRFIAALLPLPLLAAAPAKAEPARIGPSDKDARAIAAFDEYLAAFRQERHIPALSVAVLKDGGLLWEKAYGWSDDEGDTPATVDTVFSIASVTKPIAAAAIIAEAEAGRIDLDTPMAADPGWANTCGWLSQSGILFGSGGEEPDGTAIPAMDCARAVTLRDMLNMRVNGDGSAFVYNPVSYARIDRAITGVGGRDLRTIVRERVMDRADIHDIALGWRDPQGGSALRLLALPMKYADGRFIRTPVSDDDFRAASGIKASVRHLARFDMALDAGKLLPAEWRARIFAGPVPEAGDYRWGWWVQDWTGHRIAWHSGWDPERYSAMYLKLPGERLTLIVLANSESVWWDNSLARAEIETSPLAAKFLAEFVD